MIISIIALIALAYGSYTDIKTREIPDTLSIGLIFLGIAIALCSSILFLSFKPLLASIVGLTIGSLIGLLLYFSGQWGGGDAKMLMGLGSLIGIDVFTLGTIFPQMGLLMINIIIFGAIYGVFWIIFLALKNWKSFNPQFTKMRREPKMIRIRIIFFIVVIVFTVAIFIFKPEFSIIVALYLLMMFTLMTLYMFMIIKIVEKNYMIKKINIAHLTEGDWIVEKVKLSKADKYIYTKTGLSTKGLEMLKKSGKKKITVKEGVPFIPSFLIAYIITIVFGNWFLFLI